ncbi:M60 family metallopeptidase [Marinilabiliaceae bacterium ANBcel2]|nr:M60 family metallopeptidase [Marinilabiliaceae bacterium ANBcel2]
MNYLKNILAAIFLFSILLSCSDDDDDLIVNTLQVSEQYKAIGFLAEGSTRYISVETNAETLDFDIDSDWIEAQFFYDNSNIAVSVQENASLDSRSGEIFIRHEELSDTIEVTQTGVNPSIAVQGRNRTTDFREKTIEVDVISNVDIKATASDSWLTVSDELKSVTVDPVRRSYEVTVDLLSGENERTGYIYYSQVDGELKDSLTIHQQIIDSDSYEPETADQFERDKQIGVLNAELYPSNLFQSGQGIENTIDGDRTSLYHSPWGGMAHEPDITLEYHLDPDEAEVANYIVLYPRQSGSNGIFKTGTVSVLTDGDNDFAEVAQFDLPNSSDPQVVYFDSPVIEPRKIQVTVTDAYSHDGAYHVSLAQFEVYESRSLNALEEDLDYFTDITFSELKPGLTIDDIADIENGFLRNIAAYMLSGKYDDEYRVQEYRAYRPVWDLANELKTSTYSQFENPTGMFFRQGEEVVVFVGETNGERISLRVKDFGRAGDDNSYVLNEGVNIIEMEGRGNGYISYYTLSYETAPEVKVHIASGDVNGVFDISKHDNDDGKVLLDGAVSDILDIMGERVQLAYSVNDLKSYSYNRLEDLTLLYDSIVSSQQTMMGLAKYDRLPDNHMLGRVIWEGFMHADGWGAAFHTSTMSSIANPDNLVRSIWGPAHEFGHVNQTRPGFMWVGTTEVTNNIFAMWNQFTMHPDGYLRLEHENSGGIIGGRFDAYFNNAFINNQEWNIQAGPDRSYGAGGDNVWGGDVFVALAPMWQLHLFFHIAGEDNPWHKPYFYGDVFEAVRVTNQSGMSQGELQLDWVKHVCDAVELDLTDFFVDIGMLQEIDKIIGDYSNARRTITQPMIDEVISHISQYPKPELNNTIKYISGNSYKAYKYRRDVSGAYGSGVQSVSNGLRVNHSTWQNVVAFKSYKEDTLSNITMVGTGSGPANEFTIVPYGDDYTRVEAVGYDGTTLLVYGDN